MRPGDPTGGAYSAPPDLLAGKGGGAPGWPPPGMGTPGKEKGRKRRGGGGEGENCCHQMSDFTDETRGRSI